jgi:hypothetical protein
METTLIQQDFLRHAMRLMKLNRAQFAECFEFPARTLDAYLLPDSSNGARKMPHKLRKAILDVLRVEELRNQLEKELKLNKGTLHPAANRVYCSDFDFVFPTLYRVTFLESGFNLKTGAEDPSTDQKVIGYSLCETFTPNANNHKVLEIEPVIKRNKSVDCGCIYVTEHSTLDRAMSFIRAIINTNSESTFPSDTPTYYEFEKRIFTLVHLLKPYDELADEQITYFSSDFYVETRETAIPGFSIEGKNNWERIFRANDTIGSTE